MKRIILSFLIVAIVYSCDSKKDHIELFEDENLVYTPVIELDSKPEFNGENKLADEIEQVFKENWKGFSDLKETLIIGYNYYVGEDGKIKKMQRARFGGKFGFHIPDNYTEDIEPKIIEKFQSVKFGEALKDGKKVKFRSTVTFILTRNKQNKIERIIYMGTGKEPENAWKNFSLNEGFDFMISVDEQPEPIGGVKAIQNNIKYPSDAKKKGLVGMVFVKAFLDEHGKVLKTEIIKGTNTSLDTAAAQAVMLTKFTPGKIAGNPVKTQVAVPIVFKLK